MRLRYSFFAFLLAFTAALPAQLPVAICNYAVEATVGPNCTATITPDVIDDGSYTFTGTMRLLLNRTELELGLHEVTLKVNDGRRSAGCTTLVRVVDKTPPVATCRQTVTVWLDDPTTLPGVLTVADVDAGTYDNCGGWTGTVNVSGLTYFGSTIYNLTVTDDAGNPNTCYGTVHLRSPLIGNTGYCYARGDTRYEFIERFSMLDWYGDGINVNSGNNNGGVFFTTTRYLTETSRYDLSYAPGYVGSAYNEYWSVYLDVNRDGDFTDAGELLHQWSGTGANTDYVILPSFPVEGYSRLRVVMGYGGHPGPCGTSFEGEMEDYVVYLQQSGTGALTKPDAATDPQATAPEDTGVVASTDKQQRLVRKPRLKPAARVYPTVVGAGQPVTVRLGDSASSLSAQGARSSILRGARPQVQELVLNSQLGQAVATFPATDGPLLLPADLHPGVYLLTARDRKGAVVWTERLVIGR